MKSAKRPIDRTFYESLPRETLIHHCIAYAEAIHEIAAEAMRLHIQLQKVHKKLSSIKARL